MKKILALLLSLSFIFCCACGNTEESVHEESGYEETVYVTNSGSKYHSDGCVYLKYSSNEIDLSEAEEQGYTPCSKCR